MVPHPLRGIDLFYVCNTIINIHVGTDGDINVDTDALVERVSTTSAPIATVLIATSTDK